MSLEVKIGGINASVGNQASEPSRSTLQGSARRSYFKGQLSRIPPELRGFMLELLDSLAFRDEVTYKT